MADDGVFATNAEVVRKAGAGADATATAVAYTDDYLAQVEGFINIVTRNNWSDAYGALNVDVKGILKEAATNLAAIYVIQYNMRDYTSRYEAETMCDILRDGAMRCLSLLKDKKVEDFMEAA